MATERVERPRGSLVNKLRWPIVISVAIALLIVGSVPIYIGGQAQRREILRVQQGRAEGIALSLSLYLQGAKNGLASFAQAQVALDRAERQVAFEQLLARGQSVYDEITLLDQEGNEVAKVSRFHTFLPAELGSQADTAAFQRARKGMDHIVKEPVISPYSGLPTVEMAVPVRDPASGDVTGVLMARVSIKQMWDEVAAVEVGERGYAYVINRAGRLLIHTDLSRYLQSQGEEIGRVPVVEKIIQAGVVEAEAEEYTGLDGERVVGAYAPIEGTPWITIVELPAEEAYASIQRMTISLIGLLMVAVLAIAGLTSWLPQRIIRPLAQLEEGAALLSSGRLGHRIALRTGDELEALGEAFNQMASRLQELYAGLEQQVADRTRELERRAIQLQAAADVAREATAIRDVNQLLDETVRLISERFGFYHAGVFLVDDAREYAILRAASSEGGQRMLARGHKLAVGKVGMVGYVTGTGEPRIALDVGEDAVHFVNPDLPETRSEMTLPLRVRGEILGALDVQSTEEAAFTDEDVATLGTMADQLAVAIENARLFRETQDRLRELSRLYGEYSTAAWTQLAPPERPLGYVYDRVDVTPVEGVPAPVLDLALQRGEAVALVEPEAGLAMPLKVRDQIIGALGFQETDEVREWSLDEIALVEAVSSQVAMALENARLFEEARVRAEELAVLNELGQALTARLTVEEVLDAAYRGASRLLDTTNFYIGLYDAEKDEIAFPLDTSRAEADRQITILPASQGLTGYIIRNRTSVLIKENVIEHLARMGVEPPGQIALSWLGVPLVVGDRILGVMAVQNYTTPRAYSEHDRDLLTAIASQSAIALESARLFEQVQDSLAIAEMRARYQTNVAYATAALTERGTQSLREVLRLLGEAAQVSRVYYFETLEGEEGVYWRQVAEWCAPGVIPQIDNPDLQHVPVDALLFWKTQLQATGIVRGLVKTIPSPEREILEEQDIQSVLILAVLGESAVPGFIGFDEITYEREWGDDEVAALQTAAAALANTIARERLFAQVQETLSETEALYRASWAIGAATSSAEVGQALMNYAATSGVDAARVLLFEHDEQGRPAYMVMHERWTVDDRPVQPYGTRFPLEDYPLADFLNRNEPVIVEDVLTDPRANEATRTLITTVSGLRSFAMVPITVGERWIGLVFAGRNAPSTFAEELVRGYRTLAGQAGVAFENIRLLEETRRHLEHITTLYEIGQEITSTLDLNAMLQTIVGDAARLAGCEQTLIALLDAERQELLQLVGHGYSEGYLQSITFEELWCGLTGWVVREKKPTLTEDMLKDERETGVARERSRQVPTGSVAVAPLMVKGQIIGTLTGVNPRGGPIFTQEDLNLFVMLAGQAAIAIENARLFEETQATLAETEALYRASRAIVVAQTPDDVLRAFTGHVVAPQIGRCVLALIDPTTPPDDPVVEIEAAWEPGGERPAVLGNRWTVSQIPFIARMLADLTVISDVSTSPELDELSRHIFLNVLDIKAVAIVPLLIGERHLGWLLVESLEGPYDFSAREVRLYRALAGQAAVALESMRLFGEAQRRARRERLIHEITAKVWASTDLESVLKTTAQELSKALGTSHALVRLGTPPQVDD